MVLAILASGNVFSDQFNAFHQAFVTSATGASVPVDAMRSYLGHALASTMVIYNMPGASEIIKLLAQLGSARKQWSTRL